MRRADRSARRRRCRRRGRAFWSIPAVHGSVGRGVIASISVSVHDQSTVNSQSRPPTPPADPRRRRRCVRPRCGRTRPHPAHQQPAPVAARQPGDRQVEQGHVLGGAVGGRSAGSWVDRHHVIGVSQVARLGQNPIPPLVMGCALSLSEDANTPEASRSTTVIPPGSRPATRSQGNPCGRAASSPHQCRRNVLTAVLTPASCSSPASDSARYTMGVEATGPITGARCCTPWKSLIASPPRICATAMSIRTWPRS